MNFILHLKITEFFNSLKAGTMAYRISFAKGIGDEKIGYVLVTTDHGVDGGTVHALQIQVQKEDDESQTPLGLAMAASETIETFLKRNQVNLVPGILSTAGLHETLENWGHVNRVSISRLNELLAIRKKTRGDRRNKNNK